MAAKIFRKINNRYFWVGLAFLVWIVFFDRYNLIERFKISRELKEAKRQKEYYENEIRKDKKEIEALITDTASLEKFAREKYLMKRDNEDIFLIIDENK